MSAWMGFGFQSLLHCTRKPVFITSDECGGSAESESGFDFWFDKKSKFRFIRAQRTLVSWPDSCHLNLQRGHLGFILVALCGSRVGPAQIIQFSNQPIKILNRLQNKIKIKGNISDGVRVDSGSSQLIYFVQTQTKVWRDTSRVS